MKTKKKSSLGKKKTKAKKPYVFGSIKKQTFDQLVGSERGSIIKVYGLVCNSGMYTCDPYNCTSNNCDNRC